MTLHYQFDVCSLQSILCSTKLDVWFSLWQLCLEIAAAHTTPSVIVNHSMYKTENIHFRLEKWMKTGCQNYLFCPMNSVLDNNLHLGWQWLKYSGLHPSLLLISTKQHRVSELVRCLFTWIILLLSLTCGIFETIQLIIRIWNVAKMVEAVPNFIFTNYIIVAIVCQHQIWYHRDEIVELFNDWKQLDMQSKYADPGVVKRFTNRYCVWGVVFSFTMGVVLFTENWLQPHKSYFLSHYSTARETLGLLTICAVQSLSSSYMIVATFASNFLPVIVFYHTAWVVGSLVEEWDAQMRNEDYFRAIWDKYERILHLVDRANRLFGTLLLVFHSHLLFMISMTVFYSIDQLQSSSKILPTSITTTMSMSSVLFIYNWILSQLYFSTVKLKKLVSDVMSQKWLHMDQANRHLLVSFHARLDPNRMSVHPLNLFTVRSSNLLFISGVILNYVIVLANSR